MPGKAEISREFYLEAFEAAVEIFGKAQVSTYLLAGLGDSEDDLLEAAKTLIPMGVYPFIVPFVPVTGTELENHLAPDPSFMRRILDPVGNLLTNARMTSETIKAGCAKCGACSPLTSFENQSQSNCYA